MYEETEMHMILTAIKVTVRNITKREGERKSNVLYIHNSNALLLQNINIVNVYFHLRM